MKSYKNNRTIVSIITFVIIFVATACSDKETSNFISSKVGDNFMSGGEIPAFFYEMLDGNVIEFEYKLLGYMSEEYNNNIPPWTCLYHRYILNEEYTEMLKKDGNMICYDFEWFDWDMGSKTWADVSKMNQTKYRKVFELRPDLGGVTGRMQRLQTNPWTGETYDWHWESGMEFFVYEKAGVLYEYCEDCAEPIIKHSGIDNLDEWDGIIGSATYTDVKIIRK